MAVGVDQPGQHPAAVEHGVGGSQGLRAQDTLIDPPLDRLTVGQTGAANVERCH